MNPTNDRLVKITADELAAILESRRQRGLAATYPKTAPVVGRMTATGRLWWVVEFIMQARQPGRSVEAVEAWLGRAQRIAAVVAHRSAKDSDTGTLRAVADALEGKHAATEPCTVQQRVLSAVGAFCATYGRNPTQREVREFARKQGIILRVEDVSEVMRDKFKPGKRGPKPN